ncbi:MAG: hypothetical protein AAF432_08335 [Planctomycetota bacterium]
MMLTPVLLALMTSPPDILEIDYTNGVCADTADVILAGDIVFRFQQVANAGDVSGNGEDDLAIVGQYRDVLNPQGSFLPNYGRVEVIEVASQDVVWAITGSIDSIVGSAGVAGAADVDGDGFGDLLVGESGVPGVAQVHVYSGFAGTILRTYIPDDVQFEIRQVGDMDGDGLRDHGIIYRDCAEILSAATGEQLFFFLGCCGGPVYASGDAGDVNDDGFDDFMIRGRQAATFSDWVFVRSGIDGTPLCMYSPVQNSAQFGSSVTGLGDLDGDGLSDVAIATREADFLASNSGRIDIYSSCQSRKIRVHAPSVSIRFPDEVLPLIDLNHDGIPEYAAHHRPGQQYRLYVFDGATGIQIEHWFGEDSTDLFGKHTIAMDMNADGDPDIVTTSSGTDGYGRIYVFLAPDGGFGAELHRVRTMSPGLGPSQWVELIRNGMSGGFLPGIGVHEKTLGP